MPLLIALFILVPILELWAIIQVGQLIGVVPTIVLLLLDSLLGAWLLRHQGRSAWRRLRATLDARRLPATEAADGALIVFGGALLLTPGFLTDIAGLLLLLPPSRALVRRFIAPRLAMAGAGAMGGPAVWTVRGATWGGRGARAYRGYRDRTGTARRDYDVEGTAVESDRPELGPDSTPGP